MSFGVWKGGGPWLVCTAIPSANVWHHLAYTYDGTTHILYIDGVEQATSTSVGQTGTVTSVQIGAASNYSEYFNGRIDEVRIYNTALTAAQISALYNQGR